MLMTVIYVALGLWVAFCAIAAVWTVYRAWPFLRVGVTTNTNDDTAILYFLNLLDAAEKTMVVYDDGNKMEGSPYDDERVIEALRAKLEQNPGFRLRCFFNEDAELLLTEEFRDHERVEIRTRSDGPHPDDIHYKVIDDGRKAYLSRHALGAAERGFKLVDCMDIKEQVLDRVTDVVLRECKADMQSKFPALAA